VQLPGTSAELLNKMREKKVDFAAHSNTEDGGSVFLNLLGARSDLRGVGDVLFGRLVRARARLQAAPLLFATGPTPARCHSTLPPNTPRPKPPPGNLAFPLLLVGGLFLLSRRSGGAGGMGGPGGNNPMAFGKSKARFQMEPNTGVTFSDVAGVDEAKQDFMEIVEFLKRPERFTAVGARIPKGCLLVRRRAVVGLLVWLGAASSA